MITHHIKFPDKHDTSVYTILILKYVDSWNYGNSSQEEVKFELTVVNESSVFEPLKFLHVLYIICQRSFFCF